jgi:hypothetical protein
VKRRALEMLRLQWLSAKWLLLPLVLICVGLPQAVVRFSVRATHGTEQPIVAATLLEALDVTSTLFPYLAGITGALIALAAWNWDHRTHHVYALSLPVSRPGYALLKLATGAVILLIPVLALLIGAWIATAMVPLPDGLRAYPFAFAARFLLAALLVYATVFALAAGTIRTTLVVVVGVVLLLIVGGIAAPFLETQYLIDLTTPIEMIGRAPGPLRVFAGSWLMIDV